MAKRSADYWAGYRDALAWVQAKLNADRSLIGLARAAIEVTATEMPAKAPRPTVLASSIGWSVTTLPPTNGADEALSKPEIDG